MCTGSEAREAGRPATFPVTGRRSSRCRSDAYRAGAAAGPDFFPEVRSSSQMVMGAAMNQVE